MYYYRIGSQTVGPIDYGEVTVLIRNNQVLPTTMVWRDGMAEWLPAIQTELRAFFPQPAGFPGFQAPVPGPRAKLRPAASAPTPVAGNASTRPARAPLATEGSATRMTNPKSAVPWKDKKTQYLLVAGVVAMAAIVGLMVPYLIFGGRSKETPAGAAAVLDHGGVGDRQVLALGGGQRIALRYVPAGMFTMGDSGVDATTWEVALGSGFWMGETELTQGQWKALMGNNPSHFKGDPNLPVESASWDDAQACVKALNTRAALPDAWHWALPTEAQWEYACRAGTTGGYAGDLNAMAWHLGNSDHETHAVGKKQPNAWGLFDMHGNVEEWCADWYGDYPKVAASDPTGPITGSERIARGGAWLNDGEYCRSAIRSKRTPESRGNGIGLRVVAVPSGLESDGTEDADGGLDAVAPDASALAVELAKRKRLRPSDKFHPPAAADEVEWAGAQTGGRHVLDLGIGAKLELCGIPAGSFTMGGSGTDETPYEVTLTKPFWLGRTEVTQVQWDAVSGRNPSRFKGGDLPVENVSWDDAVEFCDILNAKNLLPVGWQFTLPSEAQWEYACRGGTIGEYANTLDNMAWHQTNSGAATHPVGTKQANAYGLNDMHGNVWEWCADWYGPYPNSAAINPAGPYTGTYRVSRGGAWDRDGNNCRSANRNRSLPDFRRNNLGLRLAVVQMARRPAPAAAVPAETAHELARPAATGMEDVAAAKTGNRREVYIGGGANLDLCEISAGSFTMGGTGEGETPHKVTLTNSFWLGRTEVTQAQWLALMGSNPSTFKAYNLPVEGVTWDNALEFCNKLNAKKLLSAGWIFALPSEAQWEYACRAGTTGEYAGALDTMAWYSVNSGATSHPVGTKQANAWGLYDMHGNVWEWCADWHGPYPLGAATDPTGPNTGSYRVYRGGSWLNDGTYCRSAYRGRNAPGVQASDIGFRVAAVPVAGPMDGGRLEAVLGGNVNLDLRAIPAGSFQMGNAMAEDTDITNAPIHTVTLSVFYMAKNLVTKADWDAVRTWGLTHGYTDLSAGAGKATNHPVHTVRWYDVVKWCNARSEMDGLTPCYSLNGAVYRTTNNDAVVCNWSASGYRLPTEAEWEKAARGGLSGKRFPWGDSISHANANFNNSGPERYQKGTVGFHPTYKNGDAPYTSPVGSFPANGYGLYDMAGNVWEWCWDWHGAYEAGAQKDPRGASSGTRRVLRSGDWYDYAFLCSVASRNDDGPPQAYDRLGFRVARSSGGGVAVPVAGQAGAIMPAGGAAPKGERVAPATTGVLNVMWANEGERRAADLGGGVKLDLCGIPAGSFTRGGANEVHRVVTLTNAFWLGRTEVTRAQWQALMGNNPSNFKGENLPVDAVSWQEAVDFCNKLNAKKLLSLGWKFALPSEAQWEYACRAGTKGDNPGNPNAMAWHSGNSGDTTHPVGTKQPNAWGLYDMLGNVNEWCADWYGDYPKGAAKDWTGPKSGASRVNRGGDYYNASTFCNSTFRGQEPPSSHFCNAGFRVAVVPVH